MESQFRDVTALGFRGSPPGKGSPRRTGPAGYLSGAGGYPRITMDVEGRYMECWGAGREITWVSYLLIDIRANKVRECCRYGTSLRITICLMVGVPTVAIRMCICSRRWSRCWVLHRLVFCAGLLLVGGIGTLPVGLQSLGYLGFQLNRSI